MSATGPQYNTYNLPEVALGDTFHEWRAKTNDDIIGKLNHLKIYSAVSGDGISADVDTAGVLTVDLSDHITKGITFSGDVTFSGSIVNMDVTNITVDDYNLLLGATPDTAGTGDDYISAQGGGGIVIARSGFENPSVLWKPRDLHGETGAWEFSSPIGLSGGIFGIDENIRLLKDSGGSGEGFVVGFTASNGSSGGVTLENDVVLYHQASGSTLTDFMQVQQDGLVKIHDGANHKKVKQVAHGFTFGNVVSYASGEGFTGARANRLEEAEAIGIVSKVYDDDTFDITFSGEVVGNFSGAIDYFISGQTLNPGHAYFLSKSVKGNMQREAPIQPGHIRKPMMVAIDEDRAIVTNYIGAEIAEAFPGESFTARNTITINQQNAFNVGDPVTFMEGETAGFSGGWSNNYRLYDGDDGYLGPSGGYVHGVYKKAQANTSDEAEVIGMVTQCQVAGDSNLFKILLSGYHSGSNLGDMGLTAGKIYYLKNNVEATGVTGDAYDTIPPTSPGSINIPVFYAVSDTEIYRFQSRGVEVPNASDSGGGVVGSSYNYIDNGSFHHWRRGTTFDPLAPGINGAGLSFDYNGRFSTYGKGLTVGANCLYAEYHQDAAQYQKNQPCVLTMYGPERWCIHSLGMGATSGSVGSGRPHLMMTKENWSTSPSATFPYATDAPMMDAVNERLDHFCRIRLNNWVPNTSDYTDETLYLDNMRINDATDTNGGWHTDGHGGFLSFATTLPDGKRFWESKTFTLSFWARASSTAQLGIFCGVMKDSLTRFSNYHHFGNGATDRKNVKVVDLTNEWQHYTFTFTTGNTVAEISDEESSWDAQYTRKRSGMKIQFYMGYSKEFAERTYGHGTIPDYQISPGFEFISGVEEILPLASNDAFYDFAGVRLQEGTEAIIVRDNINDDLVRCKHFYNCSAARGQGQLHDAVLSKWRGIRGSSPITGVISHTSNSYRWTGFEMDHPQRIGQIDHNASAAINIYGINDATTIRGAIGGYVSGIGHKIFPLWNCGSWDETHISKHNGLIASTTISIDASRGDEQSYSVLRLALNYSHMNRIMTEGDSDTFDWETVYWPEYHWSVDSDYWMAEGNYYASKFTDHQDMWWHILHPGPYTEF